MNNFNFLRLVFALFVVITHSYSLSGALTSDYLREITGYQVAFSYLGIYGFFIISGYLVFQSLDRSKSLFEYFKKRALRIFPGLFVVLLLTVLLGYIVYEGGFLSYVSNKTVWTYLPWNFTMIRGQGMIDGIFTHNPYNPTINGSLWSLQYEVLFYIGLAALFFFKRRAQIFLLVFLLIVLLAGRLFWYEELSIYHLIVQVELVFEYAPLFFSGSLLAILKIEKIKSRKLVLVSCTVLLVILTVLEVYSQAKFFLLPVIVILAGLESIPFINRAIDKLGDISYGVYIYAFPIQQTLMHYFSLNALELMFFSIILSCVAGYASWHCVEKYALRFKNRLATAS